MTLNVDHDLRDCGTRRISYVSQPEHLPFQVELTDLDEDSKQREDDELSNEQECRVPCSNDPVGLRVRRRTLEGRDPAAPRSGHRVSLLPPAPSSSRLHL